MKYDIEHTVVKQSSSSFIKKEIPSIVDEKKELLKSEIPSKLGKWVIPNLKTYKDDEEINNVDEMKNEDAVLIKEKTSKINWGERRATLISYPQEPIEILFSKDELKCSKFEV